MKPITLEWVAKAEGDWDSAQREYRARQRPHYDAACFHAQQCAEKYLKVKLEEAAIAFGRSHNLISLLTLVQQEHGEPLREHRVSAGRRSLLWQLSYKAG